MEILLPTVISNREYKSQLILGAAFMLKSYQVSIFCKSLRANSVDTTIALFVDRYKPLRREVTAYSDLDIQYIERSSLPLRFQRFDSTNLRWILYRRYLLEEERHKHFKYIWMFDVDDVYFQSDPFKIFVDFPVAKDALVVFQQGGFRTVGECALTTKVIRDCFGADVLSNIDSQKIINPGAIAATTAAALQFLDFLATTYSGDKVNGVATQFFPACEQSHADQGLLNTIVHYNLLPDLNIYVYKEEEKTFVAHLQSSKLTQIKHSKVYNKNDELIPIVHGYDTNYDLHLVQTQLYAPFTSVKSSTDGWNETQACEKYTLIAGVDHLANTCDLKIIQSLSATLCCELCDKAATGINNCHAFTFIAGLCYLKHCETDKQYATTVLKIEEGAGKAELTKGLYFAYRPLERNKRSQYLREELKSGVY